jgi:hypothetical protein
MRVPMPLASLLNDRFLALLAHGGDKLIGRQSNSSPARTARSAGS